jgi:hypothetical protein
MPSTRPAQRWIAAVPQSMAAATAGDRRLAIVATAPTARSMSAAGSRAERPQVAAIASAIPRAAGSA